MSLPGDSCVQACPNCGTSVDITDQEPLSKFQCPECGAAMRASRQFNHFSIVEHLGTGGMGAVYKALDRNLNRMVALKLLRRELSDDATYIAKLEDEARITASINHPFVVKVFSFGQDHGQYYIAMELVDKGTLDDLMQLQNRIAELQVLQVGLQIASGLQAAHERGLIHRDVKPGNILFADAHTAKITDFGLALLAEHEADARGEIWGTPYYIAPEKLSQQPEDFRSDIYSLGGTLFHALAGRPPFEAESASLVALKHLKSKAVSIQAFAPDVANETAFVINRMLQKDPTARYASYGELIEHLRYASDRLNANLGKGRTGRQRVVVQSQHQNHLAGVLTLALLVLMLVGGVLAYTFRARLFGTGAGGQAVLSAQNAPPDLKVSPDAKLDDARHQIVVERYADAQAAFTALAQTANAPQPVRSWARLGQGMAALLNHQLDESRAVFAGLQNDGLFSKEDNQRALANFFVETGRSLATPDRIPASVAKDWNQDTFENLALLLFGLKDWELGAFKDADALFKSFLDGKPAGPYDWITEYAPIARKATHDYALYAPLRERVQAGSADKVALRADLGKARELLQTSGKLVEEFSAAEAALNTGPPPANGLAGTTPTPPVVNGTPRLAPAAADATPPPDARETARWQAARESYQRLVSLGRFDEAESVLDHVKVAQLDHVRAHNLLDRRVRAMVAFKKTLLNDLKATGGYPLAVTSRQGVTYPRGLRGVQGDQLLAGTPYGQITVAWTDFDPAVYLAVAGYYADAVRNPPQAAERRWLAANYAVENGRVADAKGLASQAARDLPKYASEIGQFDVTGPR